MTTIVIMPGGFHPFHAGHMSLYNSARHVFPDAEVYVAATNDTATRPFPFAIKEKLAKLAGVEPGHFVQVKSPFQATEIKQHYDPEKDVLIFVRSEKDQNTPPKPGGVKKDGSPSYLQPLLGAKKLEPFGKRAYMAYLPTVEFGPGMTSATQIRAAWPTLDERRKTALVMSLYPTTQKNPKLAATVVKLLDTAIGSEQGVAEGANNIEVGDKITWWYNKFHPNYEGIVRRVSGNTIDVYAPGSGSMYRLTKQDIRSHEKKSVEENQGWAATFTNEESVNERKKSSEMPADYARDPELYKLRQYAKQHYGRYSDDPEMAMMKLLQRSFGHSEEKDAEHDAAFKRINAKLAQMQQQISKLGHPDYVEENQSTRKI